MRTRFRCVNYFKRLSIEGLDNLNFFRLPVPHFSPLNICDSEETCCFGTTSSVSLEIERLPVENALSVFFSDVLPHTIDVDNGDISVIRTQGACIDEWKTDDNRRKSTTTATEVQFHEEESDYEYDKEESLVNCGSGTVELKILKVENEFTGEEENNRFKVIQLETPELDCLLEEHVRFSHKEDRQIFSQISEIENSLDMVDFKSGTAIHYPCEVTESVYSVDNIHSKVPLEQRSSCFVEDAGFVLDCCSKFPFLEVNEIRLEYYMSPSMGELHLMLENIEDQKCTQNFDLMVDSKDLLGSIDINLLECLSGPCPLDLCLPESSCLDLALDMDFFCTQDAVDIKGVSVMCLRMSGYNFFSDANAVQFQEVEILDLDTFQFSEVFSNSHIADGAGICDQTLKDDMDSVWKFYESVVNNELALLDDTFKPLLVPVLSDGEDIQLFSALDEILAVIEPLPPSASDGIYLDWHLLEGEAWNLEEIDTYNTDAELNFSNSGVVGIDFAFEEETPDVSSVSESKEILVEITGVTMGVNEPLTEAAHSWLSKDNQKVGKEEVACKTSSDKVTMLFESMSQSNDLDFFVNPKKAIARRIGDPAVPDKTDGKAKLHLPLSSNPTAICASAEVKPQQWGIEVHQIGLSDHILSLVSNFEKSYLATLENEVSLKEQIWPSFPVVDNFNLLSIKKQNLMDLIKSISARQTTLVCEDETIVALVTLYAIKQMACYLCFYGIHMAHLYADNLFRSNKYLRCRLNLLQSLINDAYQKADTEITESHLSLSVIQGILRKKISQSGSKVLIVADQLFWVPLKRLLNVMGISFHEVQDVHKHADQTDPWNSNMFTKIIMNSMLHSDCLLISHKNVCASLPFNKFNIILEYGGPHSSSKIFSFSPNFPGVPHLHFLKVELEEFSAPKALCEGFYTSHNDLAMEEISQSISTINECINDHKFEEQFYFGPVSEKCVEYSDAADYVKDSSKFTTVPSMTSTMESKPITSVTSYPDIVIIVNTLNFYKETLMYRRSSYQRILAMEKQGVQVVEREISLPVDLILSAAVCLVFYDCDNIKNKASLTDEASSRLTLYVEHIATNTLTSLSFSFSSCILIFEGESSFLADIMDSSDALYAAASSLGLDLQLFCSYSAELTDDIIMSCITYATKLNKGLCPKMFESETLAESFLTSFPSINPLSSHAILTSGGMLVEFLECSHDDRIQAVQKYHVPDESLSLFSALCRYGEREDSKSGMTECSSSSVSPVPDSGNSRYKSVCDRKRRKYMTDAQTFQFPMEEMLVGAPQQSADDILKPSRVSQPYHSQVSKNPEKFESVRGHNLSSCDQWFDQKEGLSNSVMNDLYSHSNNFENFHKGEVIDLDNSSLLGEDFSVTNTTNFSTRMQDIGCNPTRNSANSGKSLFDTEDLTCLPASLEISFGSDICSSRNDPNQKLEGNICAQLDMELDKDTPPITCQREFLKARTKKGSTADSGGLLFADKNETAISKVFYSSQLQQRSPWTMEFLSRIKEKSKMHRQSLPCDTIISCFGCAGNVQKVAKRSPSVLDGFRYQGGTYSKKMMKQKQQKRPVQLNSFKNGKASASLLPIWTPADKRARQTLSFVKDGNDTQRKLVWADGNVRLKKRLRNVL